MAILLKAAWNSDVERLNITIEQLDEAIATLDRALGVAASLSRSR